MVKNIFKSDPVLDFLDNVALTELHTHMGSAVSPMMLWEMAHNQGLKLPTKDYWKFKDLVVIHKAKDYEEYLLMFDLMEKIQSSPEAMFMALETAVSGAYRSNNIQTIELRFCPMFRNRHGERDLDHIIVFALQGMERAMLKYPVKAGIILELDRRLTHEENAGIVKKAIKYKTRGVIGIDLAGPVDRTLLSRKFKPAMVKDLFIEAKKAGLGLTFHTGEVTDTHEMWEVLKELKPDRIGHGLAAVKDPELLEYLASNRIVLEICPTSNLQTKVVKDYNEMKKIFETLKKYKVLFTINTDGPEMLQINLREEYRRLIINKVLTKEDLLKANKDAFEASFISAFAENKALINCK